MQVLKTVIIVAVLSAVAYGVYMALTGPDPKPPPEEASDWNAGAAPEVDLPDVSVPTAPAAQGGGGDAPAYEASSASTAAPAGSEAPPFAPLGDGRSAPPYVPPAVGPPVGDDASYQPFAAPSGVGEGQGETPAGLYPETTASAQSAIPATSSAPPWGAEPRSPAGNYAEDLNHALQMLDENRLDEALTTLSPYHNDPRLSPQEREYVVGLLGQLAGSVVYASDYHIIDPYEVQPGDTLEAIAARYQAPAQLLGKINGIADGGPLQVGSRIKVLPGPFDAVVDVDDQKLTLMLGGRYAGSFPIQLGQDPGAPEGGQFTVQEKSPNPFYYGQQGVIDGDSPENPIGEYWIGLGGNLGIHGTNDSAAANPNDTRGSIRMATRDVEHVYDILSTGSNVTIMR